MNVIIRGHRFVSSNLLTCIVNAYIQMIEGRVCKHHAAILRSLSMVFNTQVVVMACEPFNFLKLLNILSGSATV